MISYLSRWVLLTITAIFLSLSLNVSAQEVDEESALVESTDVDELEDPIDSVSKLNTAPLNQRQPISKAELEATYEQKALAIVNEQLRREIELLSRGFRASERRNEIQFFGLGALVALIFLGIGFLAGKRFGGRRRL